MTSNFSVEHSLGITKQPEESCSINHDLHHKLSFFRDEIISAAKDVDYYKDDVFLVPPKKKEIKHLIGIIKQLAQWKKSGMNITLVNAVPKSKNKS